LREAVDLASKGVGRRFETGALAFGIHLACGTQETVPTVLDFSGYNLPRNRRTLPRVIGGTEVRASQGHTGISHACQTGVKVAIIVEKIHGHSMFPTKIQGGRTDRAWAEDAD
jgi:hypothetical protein